MNLFTALAAAAAASAPRTVGAAMALALTLSSCAWVPWPGRDTDNCLDDDSCEEPTTLEVGPANQTWYCYGTAKDEPWDCKTERDAASIQPIHVEDGDADDIPEAMEDAGIFADDIGFSETLDSISTGDADSGDDVADETDDSAETLADDVGSSETPDAISTGEAGNGDDDNGDDDNGDDDVAGETAQPDIAPEPEAAEAVANDL